MELCRASLALFDGVFQHKCEVSVFARVFSAGSVSAGGKSPAAQGTVSHVSLPCSGHPGPLPAPGSCQAAGC